MKPSVYDLGMKALARAATPESFAEWGSAEQVEAEKEYFIALDDRLDGYQARSISHLIDEWGIRQHLTGVDMIGQLEALWHVEWLEGYPPDLKDDLPLRFILTEFNLADEPELITELLNGSATTYTGVTDSVRFTPHGSD